MAELTVNPSPDVFATKVGSKSCKSELAQGSADTSPLNPLIYVRYRDHVIFKNILQPSPEAIERETVGWLAHENQEILLIEHDRTIEKKGKGNGIIILRSCIVEVKPLQKVSNWYLNCKQAIEEDEYAFRPNGAKNSLHQKEQNKMIQRTTLAPAITRAHQLSTEELKSLNLPLIFQGDLVIIERSLNNWKLRTPIAIELKKILAAKEKGLIDYIFRSCLNERPAIIPYIFNNESLLKLARHFLRHCSGSNKSCMLYAINVRKYAEWLGYSPDAIIKDTKPVGAIPDPLMVQNHCGFLNDYLAELQDSGLKPAAVCNCIKAAKTFYRVNGVKKVELDEPLSRKVSYKDRAPKPEEITTILDKAATRESFIIAGIASGGFREGTFSKLKYRHVKEDLEAGRVPIHIHVEAAITKGKYHDYDTFLNAEASKLLKLYIDERRHGSREIPT